MNDLTSKNGDPETGIKVKGHFTPLQMELIGNFAEVVQKLSEEQIKELSELYSNRSRIITG
jgi:hypothetical protein